jgi:ankyrin repeat protein
VDSARGGTDKIDFSVVVDMSSAQPVSNYDGALRNAANNGEAGRVSELLLLGANPNVSNKQGDTALVLASRRGYGEVVRILLEHGANPVLQGAGRLSPLAEAIYFRHAHVVELLLQPSAHHSSEWLQDGLRWAIRGGAFDMARDLLKAGADPTKPRKKGGTPLDMARAWLADAGEHAQSPLNKIIALMEQHDAESEGNS